MSIRKVGIVGVGHVGAHVAYSLLIQGIADELVLVDHTESKVKSEVQDLRDAVAYAPHRCKVHSGDYSDLKDCDVIVHSAGKVSLLVGNHDRLTELNYTIPMVRSYAQKIKDSGFNGILINITNPCDVVTRELAKILDLPKGHVFGTGTGLDTSRLLAVLNRQTQVDHKSINAFMIGEHGNKQFCPWSCVSFKCTPLSELEKVDSKFQFDHEQMQKDAIGGGWVTFSGKQCTEFGIASTAAKMVSLVLHDEKAIIPASAELTGEYGESDVFAGVPCIIGKEGIEKIIELPLTEKEKQTFHECCDGIRENIKHADELK